MATEARVKELIAGNKVMVFSKSYCPFCKKAKTALNQFTSHYGVLELDSDSEGDAIQDIMLTMTGGRSVPRVFIDGKFIGGGDETAAAAADGTLAKLIGAPVPA